MRRALSIFVVVVVLLATAAAVVYAVRSRRARVGNDRMSSAQQQPMANMPADGAAPKGAAPAETPRGDVTIDPRRQQLIGVRTVPVTRTAVSASIRTVGVVRADETRQADINLKLEGWIRELYVDYTGQAVHKGQPLFAIYSPDLLTTENEFLLALKTRDQLQGSQIEDARTRAESLVQAARDRLQLWDLPTEQIDALERSRKAEPTVTFRSPVDGFVLEKQAVSGMHVMPGQSLYKVVDLSSV